MCIQISYVEFTPAATTDLLKEQPSSLDMWAAKKATKIKATSASHALKLLYLGNISIRIL